MPICNPADLARSLAPAARLMGLDIGTKTIGLAISDVSLTIASPIRTLKRARRFHENAAALDAVIEERNVGGLVLGLPVNMDGSEGPRCQSVRQFAENLLEHRDMPLTFWDERWSTMAVTRTLLEADVSRRRRGELVDKMAAAYILQGFLDHLASVSGR